MESPGKAIKILIVDDDVAFCSSLADVLGALGYDVLTEVDPRNVLGVLSQAKIDLILVDLIMPHLDGLELIRLLRRAHPTLPIIVVSAHGAAEGTALAIGSGASDFITKPIDTQFLEIRLQRACEIENAHRLANTDPLTGLFNRRYFLEHLEEEVVRAQRYRQPFTLVMADLDHFKMINDTFGHPRGDEVLVAISRVLRGQSRRVDILARLGGDEFIALLPETATPEAVQMAERARHAIGTSELHNELFLSEEDVSLSMSFGVATFSSGSTGDELLLAADNALYQAKHKGRNQVCSAVAPRLRVG